MQTYLSGSGTPAENSRLIPPACLPRDRWYVLCLLTTVYAMNIADRYSISALIDPIRSELALSDGGVAFLTGGSLGLFYVTLGIPIAALADRTNRRNIIAVSIAVWSCMTALSGIAQSYTQLLLARFGVGIGEAGGTPPSTSILADKFPASRRPMALAIYALGASVGAYLGSSVAGGIAERYGWRAALVLLGIPGLIIGGFVRWTMREPKRGQLDPDCEADTAPTFLETVKGLARQRAAVHLLAGGTVATLWSWGLMWWMPTFLQRTHHLTVGGAGSLLGPMHLIAGTAGSLLAWGLTSLRFAQDPGNVAKALALITAIATVPSIIVFTPVSITTVADMLWMFVPAVYFFIGPVLGLLQNVVPAQSRAMASAILIFGANIANLVIAPQVVGWLSDALLASATTRASSLRWALLALAPTGFWAAWHFWRFSVALGSAPTSATQPAGVCVDRRCDRNSGDSGLP
jgi:MFS family permease